MITRALIVLTIVTTAFLSTPSPGESFTATGNMNVSRADHTATLLNNGKVLIAGGYYLDSSFHYQNTAEIYDPATGTFTATGNMTATRGKHTATLLPNGRVLITGGYYNQDYHLTYFKTAEIYDPVAGTFTATGDMSVARSNHTATLLNNGKVLVAGGDSSPNTAEIYDPMTGIFTATTGNMAVARSYHTATPLPDGKVLLTGGLRFLNTAEIYGSATGLFTATTGAMTAGRSHHAATLLPNGKVLITGGTSGNTAELYNPAAGTFAATTGAMIYTHQYHTATLLPDGKVLIAGGNASANSAEIYDPAAGTFSATSGAMANVRANHTATLLPDGKVLIIGGRNGGGYTLNSAEIYDPASRTFTAAAGPMVVGRESHTATLLSNGKVLVAGGYCGGILKSAEIYDPASGTFSSTTGNMASSRESHTATLLGNGKVLITGGVYSDSLSSSELYDPAAGIFTGTGSMATGRYYHALTPLANGKVLVTGGYNAGTNSVLNTAEIYDPATGTFAAASGTMTNGRFSHTATLLADGRVLISGGTNGGALSTAESYYLDPGFSPGRQPVISSVTVASGKLVLSGTGFRGDSEGSSGSTNSSSSGIPILRLQRVDGGDLHTITPDPAVNWSSTSFTASPGTLVSGHYLAVIIADGIPSNAKIVAPLVDGACGPANGQSFVSAPSASLCNPGTASAVSGSGPWTWTCAGLNGGAPATCSADVQTWQLTAYATGFGTGNVASDTGNISFYYPSMSAGAAMLIHETAVILTATADAGSTAAWSGDCTSTGGTAVAAACSFSMTGAKSVTATFGCSMQHVKNANTSAYYDTIQGGYDIAAGNQAILMHAVSFTGDLTLGNANAVTLKGGFDCNYGTNAGSYSILVGTVTLSGGAVTMENVVIR